MKNSGSGAPYLLSCSVEFGRVAQYGAVLVVVEALLHTSLYPFL